MHAEMAAWRTGGQVSLAYSWKVLCVAEQMVQLLLDAMCSWQQAEALDRERFDTPASERQRRLNLWSLALHQAQEVMRLADCVTPGVMHAAVASLCTSPSIWLGSSRGACAGTACGWLARAAGGAAAADAPASSDVVCGCWAAVHGQLGPSSSRSGPSVSTRCRRGCATGRPWPAWRVAWMR